MKKFFYLLLCVTLLFVSGCSEPANTPIINSVVDANNLLQEYLDNVNEYTSPVREYGTPASYIDMSDNLVVGILYPETTANALNIEIETWIDDLVNEYKNEISTKENLSDTAELTIAYESYLISDKTASIKFSGIYSAEYLAHPIDITKTFNVDINSGKLIKISEMFDDNNMDTFIDKTIEKATINDEAVDEHLLDNGIFTHEGIEIIFNRGDYHPMSSGTVIVKFTYDEIDVLLKPNFDHSKPSKNDNLEDIVTLNPDISPDIETTIDPDKPMIALTFDDGPSAHTERLLDVFAQYGGKGTFFVVGNQIDNRKNTLIRIANEGHEIGNHSWDHRQLTKLTPQEITDQIMMTRAKIFDVTGIDTKIMRPPYGACNNDVKSIGITTDVAFVNWSIDTLDWKTKNSELIYNEIINNTKDGDIVLCHDLHKTTVDAMETVIPKLILDGYQLVTVTELMQHSDTPLEAGKMFYQQ